MSTVSVVNVKHPSSASNNLVLDNAGNATFANNVTVTGNMTSTGMVVPSSSFLRNRIINGAMAIDQRNAGAAVTASANGTYYAADRTLFFKNNAAAFTLQQSTIAPARFNNSLAVTVTTAASSTAAQAAIVQQNIEGFNTADLGWGAAGASSVTLSFFVRSSLTGTYCVAFRNAAFTRSYIAEYTISAANTWEYKTVTIPGDTSGTWETGNLTGIRVGFDLGSGSDATGTAGSWTSTDDSRTSSQANFANTNGATFYLTGVQLEVGTAATPFERRQYGQELALCQRYYNIVRAVLRGSDFANVYPTVNWTQQMRASPTCTLSSGTASLDITNIGAYQNGAHSSGTPIALQILAAAEL